MHALPTQRRMKIFLVLIILTAFPCAGQSLRVMTYNIRFDNPGDGVNQWSNRKQKVFDLLEKYDADLIGVQEALLHQLTDITQNLQEYEYLGVGRDDGKQKGEYSAILFKKDRFEILDKNTFWLSENPEQPGSKSWDAAITRVVTWSKVRDRSTGHTFYLFNTHFDHIGKEARKNSAQLLTKKIVQIAGSLPVLVTGDFNCTRSDPPYQEMTSAKHLVLSDPAPVQPPGTFCSFEVNSMTCNPIDYIFISREWEATRYTVVNDNDGRYYPSDHLPVLVDVRIK